MPDPFLAILSHNPLDVACCSSSQDSHTLREANGMIGRSGVVVMTSPFDETGAAVRRNCERSRDSGLSPCSLLALQDHAQSLRSFPLTPKWDLPTSAAGMFVGAGIRAGQLVSWSFWRHRIGPMQDAAFELRSIPLPHTVVNKLEICLLG